MPCLSNNPCKVQKFCLSAGALAKAGAFISPQEPLIFGGASQGYGNQDHHAVLLAHVLLDA